MSKKFKINLHLKITSIKDLVVLEQKYKRANVLFAISLDLC